MDCYKYLSGLLTSSELNAYPYFNYMSSLYKIKCFVTYSLKHIKGTGLQVSELFHPNIPNFHSFSPIFTNFFILFYIFTLMLSGHYCLVILQYSYSLPSIKCLKSKLSSILINSPKHQTNISVYKVSKLCNSCIS